MKRCIFCNEKANFVKSGWFGLMFPVCPKHYSFWTAYGSNVHFFFEKDEVEPSYPENIYQSNEQRIRSN